MFRENPMFRSRLGLLTPLLLAFLNGCASTTTSVIAKEAPPVTRLHLSRSDAEPVSATFFQDGHSIGGTVRLANACSLETTRTTLSERRTTTKQSTGATIAWLVTGGVITAAGIGLMAASPHQDQRVFCGNGDTGRAGDTCDSVSSALMQVGLTTLGLGLGATALGVIGVVQKPKIETESLPPQQVTTSTPESPCGGAEALDGMLIALELPNGGRWTGPVLRDGTLRIEISPEVPLAGGEARFFIDSVPAALADVIVRGTSLGTLTLARASKEQVRRRASFSSGPTP